MAREEWLRLWGYTDGTDEAVTAWAAKQSLDARHTSAMVISDRIDPVVSQADGKTYDSKSALFKSYRADGNPQGIRYECVGGQVAQPYKPQPRDRDKAMQAVKRTLDEMGI